MLLTLPELASEMELSEGTVAYYEREELIRPAITGSFPLYGSEARLRLEVIEKAKQLGFSLSEVKKLMQAQSLEKHSRAQPQDLQEDDATEEDGDSC